MINLELSVRYEDPQGLNEIPYGAGYARTWYNVTTQPIFSLNTLVLLYNPEIEHNLK